MTTQLVEGKYYFYYTPIKFTLIFWNFENTDVLILYFKLGISLLQLGQEVLQEHTPPRLKKPRRRKLYNPVEDTQTKDTQTSKKIVQNYFSSSRGTGRGK